VFNVPCATSPGIAMHCSHPPPHQINQKRLVEEKLTVEMKPKFESLHQFTRGLTIQFPEARLIQYDCGEL
jgi:hypothetical protein